MKNIDWTNEAEMSAQPERTKKGVELSFAVISGNISHQINRIVSRTLRNEGIDMTPEQWLIMTCLWTKVEGDCPTQNMIARATFKDRPSVTRLLRNLERQELIYRVSKVGDKRANNVYLTQKGIDLEEKVKKVTQKALESIFYGFSKEEIETAFNFMDRVFENIQ